MKVFVTGNILRSAADSSRRNYVNIIVSASEGDSKVYYHVRNYQANAKSNAHRLLFDPYDTPDAADRAWNEHNRKKLGRDRVVHEQILMDFEGTDAFERAIQDTKFRFTIANARKLKNRIESDLKEKVEESGLDFEERMERRLDPVGDVVKAEEKKGVGRETAALHGNAWGMF